MPDLPPFPQSQPSCLILVECGQRLYREQRRENASPLNLKKWRTADEFAQVQKEAELNDEIKTQLAKVGITLQF